MPKDTDQNNNPIKATHYNYELHEQAKKFTSKQRPNYLGMTKKEYAEYMKSLVERYNSNYKYTLEDICNQERNAGRYVAPYTLGHWVTKFGYKVRNGKNVTKDEENVVSLRTYVSREMLDYIETFPNKSEIMRELISWCFGLPTESVMIVLSDTLRLFCLYHLPTQKYRAFLTRDVSDFEQEILNNLVLQANLYGPKVFREFCFQNDLPILGGLDVYRK